MILILGKAVSGVATSVIKNLDAKQCSLGDDGSAQVYIENYLNGQDRAKFDAVEAGKVAAVVRLDGNLDQAELHALELLSASFAGGRAKLYDLSADMPGPDADAHMLATARALSPQSNFSEAQRLLLHDVRKRPVVGRVAAEFDLLGDDASNFDLSATDRRFDFSGGQEGLFCPTAQPGAKTYDLLRQNLKSLEATTPKVVNPKLSAWQQSVSASFVDIGEEGDFFAVFPALYDPINAAKLIEQCGAVINESGVRVGRPYFRGIGDTGGRLKAALAAEVAFGGATFAAKTVRFLVPFKTPEKSGQWRPFFEKVHERERNYFYDHVHGAIGIGEGAHLVSASPPSDAKELRVEINHPSYQPPSMDDQDEHAPINLHATARLVRLLKIGNQVCLAEIEVKTEDENITLSQHMDAIAVMRLVRPTYDYEATDYAGKTKKVGLTLTDGTNRYTDITDWCAAQLGLSADAYVGDDRAFVYQSQVLRGRPPLPDGEGARMAQVTLARMMAVDGFGYEHSYAESFAKAELKAGWHDRFSDSNFVATDHSFGYRGHDYDEPDAFALKHIHSTHMETLYLRMVIYLLLIREELRQFDRRLDQITGIVGEDKRCEEVLKVRKDMTEFLGRVWFEDVSSQVQGKELFDLVKRQFGIAEKINGLERRMGRWEALSRETIAEKALNAEERQAGRDRILTIVFSSLATLLALSSILSLDQLSGGGLAPDLLRQTGQSWLSAIFATLALGGILSVLAHWLSRLFAEMKMRMPRLGVGLLSAILLAGAATGWWFFLPQVASDALFDQIRDGIRHLLGP